MHILALMVFVTTRTTSKNIDKIVLKQMHQHINKRFWGQKSWKYSFFGQIWIILKREVPRGSLKQQSIACRSPFWCIFGQKSRGVGQWYEIFFEWAFLFLCLCIFTSYLFDFQTKLVNKQQQVYTIKKVVKWLDLMLTSNKVEQKFEFFPLL